MSLSPTAAPRPLVSTVTSEAGYVLDASAVLAFDRAERGAKIVEPVLAGSVLSTITLAEVLFRYAREGVDRPLLPFDLERLGVQIEPFTTQDAVLQAGVHALDSKRRLSLGDRCCLAVAQRLGLQALTADQYWAELGPPARVRLIR